MPAGKEASGQLAASAVNHSDKAIWGIFSDVLPVQEQSVGGIIGNVELHSQGCEHRVFLYFDVMLRKAVEIVFCPDFLNDHLEPLGHERFQGVYIRDATGFGHPPVDTAVAMYEDGIYGRTAPDTEFSSEGDDFRCLVPTSHSSSKKSFTPS